MVELLGRREGLVAFLLTLIGLSPTTALVVNAREAVCETVGLLGVANRSVPMDRVALVSSGSKVAFEYIISAALMGLIGVGATIGSLFANNFVGSLLAVMVTAAFIAVSVLLYRLNKRFYVGVFSQSGWPLLLGFKPNVIEGVELNLDRAMEMSATIRDLVIKAGGRRDQAAAASPSPPTVHSPAEVVSHPRDTNRLISEEDAVSARDLLIDAQRCIRDGKRDEAIAVLRQVLRQYPLTPEADQAKRSLERAGINS